MAGWKDNPIMTWAGTKVTDHGRQPLSENTQRIGADKRMAGGTLRRQHVAVKRSWQVQWDNIPSTNSVSTAYKTVDGGMAGEDIESFYYANPGKFRLILRRGSAINTSAPNPAESALPYEDDDFYIVNVMMTEFNKDVSKRGVVDFWNVSVTLEEV
jgi:hypothetical protein